MATRDSLIRVTDLKKYYNMGAIKALDGVTVDIHEGDVMAVIGPSGSGKSTFLRSLNLLEEPTGGAIVFDGIDITKKKYQNEQGRMVKLDIDKLRQKIGMVFQHFNLFPHMTILENMILAPMKVKGLTRAEAEKRLWSFWTAWALRIGPALILYSSPADRSSGWLLCGPWLWSRRSCFSTSPPRPWIRRWWVRF